LRPSRFFGAFPFALRRAITDVERRIVARVSAKGRAELALSVLALALSAWTIAKLAHVAALRVGYPFELEWMEGGTVDHVRRLLDGKRLYVEPTLDFVPYTYTPLYFYAGALVSKVFGAGFFSLRLLTLASAFSILALLYTLVYRESGRHLGGWVAAALFAATYRSSGDWFDVCRVDCFALALAFGGIYVARRGEGIASAALAGVLFWAAFFAKQNALAIGVAASAGLAFLSMRRAAVALTVLTALVAASTVLMNRASGGWYSFYVFDVPRLHPWVDDRLKTYWTIDWLHDLPVLVVLAVAGFVVLDLVRGRRVFGFYLVVACGTVMATWAVWCRSGSYDNILMPAQAIGALLAGMGATLASPGDRGSSAVAMLAAALVQLGALDWDAKTQVPSRHDEDMGRALLLQIRNEPGDVWIPSHGFLGTMAGKPAHAQLQAIYDVWLDPKVGAALHEKVDAAIRERRFAAIVTDSDGRFDGSLAGYDAVRSVFDGDGFWPMSGFGTRPERLWRPKAR
jgi:hypothetical protein